MARLPIRLSSPALRYVAMTLDVVTIWICGAFAYGWYQGTAQQIPIPSRYPLVVLCAALLMVTFSGGLYRSWRVTGFAAILRSVTLRWLGSMLIIIAGLFLTKSAESFSRGWFVLWVLGTLAVLLLQRLVVYAGLRLLRDRGYNYKTVLLVGAGPMIGQVRQATNDQAWSGMRVEATMLPQQLAAYLQEPGQRQPDEIWLCLPLSDEAGIRMALDALRHSTANIRLVPDLLTLRLVNQGVSEVVGIPMLDLSASPMTGAARLLKTVEDYLLASLILALISPLMIAIAVAVKLTSPGPVFFKQRRHGWNGEVITVYKFRSMVLHYEEGWQVTQAQRGDTRITPLGAFLRRTSLDELPQFINVLQGRMSIVGPRPHAVQHNEHYRELVPGYMLRHKVKPGITGWAQINGYRGETDTLEKMQKRVEYDLQYIENMSLWLDLKIITLTVFKGFVHRNAY